MEEWVDGEMEGWIEEWMEGWVDNWRWVEGMGGELDGKMGGRMDRDRQAVGWKDGWRD